MSDRPQLGKSKDGRTLRGIANSTRGLHPEDEQALHRIADCLDVAELTKAKLYAEIQRLQAIIDRLNKRLVIAKAEEE